LVSECVGDEIGRIRRRRRSRRRRSSRRRGAVPFSSTNYPPSY
jgi:hypothetical protein